MSTHTPKALFFHSKLSGSENHRGFVIRDENNNHLGEVMPMDEDGIGGKALVERIADSYNALADRMTLLLKILEWLKANDPPAFAAAVEKIRKEIA